MAEVSIYLLGIIENLTNRFCPLQKRGKIMVFFFKKKIINIVFYDFNCLNMQMNWMIVIIKKGQMRP